MANRRKNLPQPGDQFCSLTVLEVLKETAQGGHVMVKCQCECGAEKTYRRTQLTSGKAKSCGCKQGNQRHGYYGTPTYRSYRSMIDRCTNSNLDHYINYGGRGVTICERWLGEDGFLHFLEDMGERPQGKTLDKDIIKKGNLLYCKEFCCWATRKEQQNHTRRNIKQ